MKRVSCRADNCDLPIMRSFYVLLFVCWSEQLWAPTTFTALHTSTFLSALFLFFLVCDTFLPFERDSQNCWRKSMLIRRHDSFRSFSYFIHICTEKYYSCFICTFIMSSFLNVLWNFEEFVHTTLNIPWVLRLCEDTLSKSHYSNASCSFGETAHPRRQ